MTASDLGTLMAFAIAFSMGFLTNYLADRKNRGGPAWGLAGFLFWPVALPWILALPAREGTLAQEAVHSDDRDVMWMAGGALVVGVAAIIAVALILAS